MGAILSEAKQKSITQYKGFKALNRQLEKKEKRMAEIQQVTEDIQDLEFVVQTLVDKYRYHKEIKNRLEAIEKEISDLYQEYTTLVEM